MKKLDIITITLSAIWMMLACGDKNKTTMTKAEYSGEDISNIATIERNKDTKKASLKIETDGKWTLYSGLTVESIDFSKPVAEGEGSGTFALNVPDSVRSYFQLETTNGKAILAERHLPMTGGYNFRDLGGFKTKDGKYVKWGKVFRSDDLHHLTDQDLQYLASIPVVTIVDFRSDEEIEPAPDKNPPSVKNNFALSISPGNVIDFMTTSKPAEELMKDLNVQLVTDSLYIAQYKEFFYLLQNKDDVPLMFHCSAGKDRTGMGAALFLYSLGVDEKTIMEDYMMSNVYLGDKYAEYIEKNPNLKSLFEVRAEYIGAAMDQIKKDHGSVEKYLTDVLGVDLPKMREMYLYSVNSHQ
ncbi:tyrosine-protein phosphatase [Dysgonomonas sp. 520]|uniref:tyrosine-protein phosphatase n=1 Tax=Dysgonomonas sp. 520 TaxID=2302931 RepID=UPI0013D82271|nr:tyrosine-protein phosphatase [Dysgonomonas sp. 520]NDW09940.1 tyrosine-protein phosphatase [Dysgonomonas sp. 520]